MLASENCDEEDMPNQRGYYGYEFIRYQLIVVDGQSRALTKHYFNFWGPYSFIRKNVWHEFLSFKKWVLRGLTQEGEGTHRMMYVMVGTYCSQSLLVFIFNESTFRSTRPSWRPCEEDWIKSLEMSPYEWVLIVDSTKVLPPSPPFFPSLPLAQSIPFSQKRRRRKDDGHIHTLASCYACFGCPLQAQDGHNMGPRSQTVCRV